MNKLFQIWLSLFITSVSIAQDTTLQKKLTISGYVKDLQSLRFNKDFGELVSGNLLHNRVNVKWKPSGKFTAVTELRNRLFWGEEVKHTPGFASLLRNTNERVNMQKVWINNKSLVLHTNVERLYADYQSARLTARIGRQRINWGFATIWNPNDIFNVYNFLDFDYEERPGVDGAKLRYTFKNNSSAEAAYAHTGKKDGDVAAVKYSFNRWNYDMQFIGGWYKDHPTVGAGWAGYIRDAGFKGELQYFFGSNDSARHLNLAVEGDYMFQEGWYLNLGFLFNDDGLSAPVKDWDSIQFRPSPENLMPTRWNLIFTTMKEISPLISSTVSVVYAPGANLLIIIPSVGYNMATNLDLNLFWQSYFAELENNFGSVSHQCFLRIKWSF